MTEDRIHKGPVIESPHRPIFTHVVPGKDPYEVEPIGIQVLDEPGPGGASHHYVVKNLMGGAALLDIQFQKGPIQEVGHNGVQQEHLLAIVADRLESFQAGPFSNAYNAEALEYTKAALAALKRRTEDRIARGVEGLNKA